MEKGIDYLKIESASDELKNAQNLMQLMNEELEDIHEMIDDVQKAKNESDLSEAKTMLAVQMENRIRILDTLIQTSDSIIREQSNNLDSQVSYYLLARKVKDDKE